jgi:alpha-beta hydrolase superfamily lysophospholipase
MIEPNRAVFRTTDGLDLVADRYGRADARRRAPGARWRPDPARWAKTAAALADRGWEAIALDLRGHGESGWSPTATIRSHGSRMIW